MSNSRVRYERFTETAKELADIAHAEALLHWDQETCMPRRGSEARASSLGTLAGLAHEKLTAREFVELVEALDGAGLTGDEGVNVRELKRDQDRAVRIPKELVVELRRTESLAHEAWVEARERSEFGLFQPWLEKIVDLKKQEAHAVGFTGSVYNALLDHFEPHGVAEASHAAHEYEHEGVGTLGDAVAAFRRALEPRGYLGLLAYLPEEDDSVALLQSLRERVAEKLGIVATLGLGPRYLHSTGQLHKGGSPSGHFIQFVAESEIDMPVPQRAYTFGQLYRAQADGDFAALARAGRAVMRVSIKADRLRALAAFVAEFVGTD